MKRPAGMPSLVLETSLVQDNVPIEIIPKVYIGSIHTAFNCEALQEQGITHIINASGLPATFPKHFTYLNINIRDKATSNILSIIPTSNLFIRHCVDTLQSGILIHCAGGRSRSPAMVIAYLMSSKQNLSFNNAFHLVSKIRPVVSLNKGFEFQLRCYDSTNNSVWKAHQLVLQQNVASYKTLSEPSSTSNNSTTTMAVLAPNSVETIELPPLRAMGTPYCCKACNHVLFSTSNMLVGRRRKKNVNSKSDCCCDDDDDWVLQMSKADGIVSNDDVTLLEEIATADQMALNSMINSFEDYVLLEPLEWMTNLNSSTGELNCPSCNIVIGNFEHAEAVFRIDKRNIRQKNSV